MVDIAVLSNGFGALSFVVLTLLLLPGWRGQAISTILLCCTAVSAAWFALLSMYYAGVGLFQLGAINIIELFRSAAWFLFLVAILERATATPGSARILRYAWYAPVLLLCLAQAGLVGSETLRRTASGMLAVNTDLVFAGFLLISITGLVLVEQLYRNTVSDRRWTIKFLCLGLGAIFAFDFFMYSDALLVRRMDSDIWNARGVVNAISVPLIAVSAARNPHWNIELFVSRQAVFHSTAVMGAGIYLLAMAAAGYYIRTVGGTWGGALQWIFIFGAIVALAVIMFSGHLRARLKVLLAKHFYSNKYDYREEWLKLTQTLAHSGSDRRVVHLTVTKAIAGFLDSPGGILWLAQSDNSYVPTCGWHVPELSAAAEEPDSPLVRFLERTGWVIDLGELESDPAKYDHLSRPDWLAELQEPWLIVPLMLEERLLGFVVLQRSQVRPSFDWEDSDLLKTVGRQTASYLALLETSEALAQARQFEAFNRLSAFVVHDLKNLIAQLSMLVRNADKHIDNADFVRDAFQTVDDAVAKMNRLLGHLRKGHVSDNAAVRVNVNTVVHEVIQKRSQTSPVPVLATEVSEVDVMANRDRFAAVLEHLIQNAQEATPSDGSVNVRLGTRKSSVFIEVTDTGCGMDKDFIRQRLFRPFDTTKGNAGMGIGVYESREFIQSLKGKLSVASRPGRGTTFTLQIPMAAPRDSGSSVSVAYAETAE
jgi:putative PEP-CTERM system histidine kinase